MERRTIKRFVWTFLAIGACILVAIGGPAQADRLNTTGPDWKTYCHDQGAGNGVDAIGEPHGYCYTVGNLNHWGGPNWNCRSMSFGSLYYDCKPCENKGEDFWADNEDHGHCVPRISSNNGSGSSHHFLNPGDPGYNEAPNANRANQRAAAIAGIVDGLSGMIGVLGQYEAEVKANDQAWALYRQGDCQGALAAYDALIAADPQADMFRTNRATVARCTDPDWVASRQEVEAKAAQSQATTDNKVAGLEDMVGGYGTPAKPTPANPPASAPPPNAIPTDAPGTTLDIPAGGDLALPQDLADDLASHGRKGAVACLTRTEAKAYCAMQPPWWEAHTNFTHMAYSQDNCAILTRTLETGTTVCKERAAAPASTPTH